MAVSLGPVSDPGAEMTLLEINQELQSQLEQSKQDFRDLKEKFLVSESTAYILANELQKYSKSYRVWVTLRVWAVRLVPKVRMMVSGGGHQPQ
uniref:Neuroblastoma breakpoint family member 5 n=1 Tax=Equus asinus TaxID=9793 RepID=A0A9L0IMW7_EQUAS